MQGLLSLVHRTGTDHRRVTAAEGWSDPIPPLRYAGRATAPVIAETAAPSERANEAIRLPSSAETTFKGEARRLVEIRAGELIRFQNMQTAE
jgi:hypothetical protein